MKTSIIKRSIVLGKRKTSISLENEFWLGLKVLAHRNQATIGQTVEQIDLKRGPANLSSAIRVYVFKQLCQVPETVVGGS